MRKWFKSGTVAVSLVVLLAAGCDRGPKLVEAGGIMKYKGAPLPGADVVLVPDATGLPSIGRTDEQGRFTITTNGRPGAPVGSYKVAITAIRQKRPVSAAEAVSMTSEQIEANHYSAIPIKYNNLITSELTATVGDDPSANEFTFELN